MSGDLLASFVGDTRMNDIFFSSSLRQWYQRITATNGRHDRHCKLKRLRQNSSIWMQRSVLICCCLNWMRSECAVIGDGRTEAPCLCGYCGTLLPYWKSCQSATKDFLTVITNNNNNNNHRKVTFFHWRSNIGNSPCPAAVYIDVHADGSMSISLFGRMSFHSQRKKKKKRGLLGTVQDHNELLLLFVWMAMRNALKINTMVKVFVFFPRLPRRTTEGKRNAQHTATIWMKSRTVSNMHNMC